MDADGTDHDGGHDTDHEGGELFVRLRFSDPQWLVRLLLQLGGDARLVEPAALAEEVRAAADDVLGFYKVHRRNVGDAGTAPT